MGCSPLSEAYRQFGFSLRRRLPVIWLLLLLATACIASRAEDDDVSPQQVASLPERATVMRWHTDGRKPKVDVFRRRTVADR